MGRFKILTRRVLVQTVKQVDPMKSGIYTLPLVLSLVVSSIASGGITQKIGYYVPSMLVAPAIMSIGEGLLSTLDGDSPTSHWVAFQFLAGFGLGFGMQTSGLAIQTVLPREDISTGIAINFFVQQLGGAVFTSVGQTILTNMLVSQLSDLPGFNAELIVKEGATKLAAMVPPEDVAIVIGAYNNACRHIFLASMGLAFASLLCAFGMEWRSIKKGRNGPPGGPGGPKPGPPGPSPAGSSGPDLEAGPTPGKPFFDGASKHKKSKSARRDSILRPKSKAESKTEKRRTRSESGKQGVLSKPNPDKNSQRPRSSAGVSLTDERKDELLAGALRDWARYSRAQDEKKGNEGDSKREDEGRKEKERESEEMENRGRDEKKKDSKKSTDSR